ncbi:MAG: apolipoprotein N-acyltransferase [Actinomycetales bacterium]|nr:apolipoprotein N-acyltransferase [Actinomycetales bacterium]
MPRLLTLGLAVAGGVVADLGFPGLDLWGLSFVGVAMLFLALGRDSARWNTLVGFVWGLAFFVPHLYWTAIVVGPAVAIALPVLEALFVALFGAAWSWARRGAVIWRSPALQVLGFAVLWVAVEELRSVAPFGGFPWGRLAFSQADAPLLRLAWLGGVPLLSAVTAAIGALLAVALLALREVRVLRTLTSLGVLVALVFVGLFIPVGTRAEAGTLRLGAVQGNVDMDEPDPWKRQSGVVDNHAAGTRALLDEVEPGDLDVVLWPENVTATDLADDERSAGVVDEAARAIDAPILLGTIEYPTENTRFNTSVLWLPGEGIDQVYRKQRPAPFSEYIPLRDFARRIAPIVDSVSHDMVGGDAPGFVTIDSERLDREVGLAVAICFEVAYDWVIREGVLAGGEVLVVQTNNVTFGYSDESVQQLAMSRVRAVETGRATVQISTVGVSGLISPNGAVSHRTELFTPDQFTATVPLRTSITPAVRLGQYIVWAFAALGVAVVVAGAVGARHVRRAGRGRMLS